MQLDTTVVMFWSNDGGSNVALQLLFEVHQQLSVSSSAQEAHWSSISQDCMLPSPDEGDGFAHASPSQNVLHQNKQQCTGL